jgi:hypothetical protein
MLEPPKLTGRVRQHIRHGNLLVALRSPLSVIRWDVAVAKWHKLAEQIAHRELSKAERDKFLK